MSKKGWPKWLHVIYSDYSGSVLGLRASVTGIFPLIDLFERYELKKQSIIELKINDEKMSESEIDKFCNWIEKHKVEYQKWKQEG